MPKRKNPFGEITPLQRKHHVGFQETATEEERRRVYEKTQFLLFRGANAPQEGACVTGGCGQVEELNVHYYKTEATASDMRHQPHPPELGGIDGHGQHLATPPEATGGAKGLLPFLPVSECVGLKQQLKRAVNRDHGRGEGGRGRGGGLGEVSSCTGCKQVVGVGGLGRCGHCEAMMCAGCLGVCGRCQGVYCSSCSVPNYEAMDVQCYCLNCLQSQ